MGGHQAGEIAAELAIGQLVSALPPGARPDGAVLVETIERANAAIRLESRSRPDRAGMGTTCTVLAVGEAITIAHVGDSRAYRYRAGRLEQLTEDHTLVATLVREGQLDPAAASADPRRHVITRALGADDDVTVDLVVVDRRPGDRFLLCSDGIHGQLDDAAIERVLAGEADPGAAADRLVALADAAGGHDNATAIVIDPDRLGGLPGGAEPNASVYPAAVRRRGGRRPVTGVVALVIGVAAVAALAAWLAVGGSSPAGSSPPSVAPSIVGSPSVAPSPSSVTSPSVVASPSLPGPS
jgi:protein phosphatase